MKDPDVPNSYRQKSALELYMAEIRKIQLLSADEEVRLAKQFKSGDSKAFEDLVVANLRLVASIAKHYENMGMPLLDLINEGNMGLMKAVERFDPDRKLRFATYGTWWIKQLALD